MKHIFSIHKLSKLYGKKRVLAIDELFIKADATTAIIGPSGAGKSTLLSILNCLEDSTGGHFVYQDTKICKSEDLSLEKRRTMAMVFQKPVLFNASVIENIAYPLKLRKVKEAEVRQRVEDMLELIGLGENHGQSARTLSGGEAQRVALARALVYRPEVLLMDEPTANLDPANVLQIEKIINHARQKYNTTVIIITHNMHQAHRLADDAVFLLDGEVVESDTVSKLYECPGDPRTKAFIHGDLIY